MLSEAIVSDRADRSIRCEISSAYWWRRVRDHRPRQQRLKAHQVRRDIACIRGSSSRPTSGDERDQSANLVVANQALWFDATRYHKII
jgi:hypothetical protein